VDPDDTHQSVSGARKFDHLQTWTDHRTGRRDR
jgi:hypothetical protein